MFKNVEVGSDVACVRGENIYGNYSRNFHLRDCLECSSEVDLEETGCENVNRIHPTQDSGLLGFWTLSIVRYSRNIR
jgi:hypothetical protein